VLITAAYSFAANLMSMQSSVERKLAAKDPELRRFIHLAWEATRDLQKQEDIRYVTNYVNGLLSGGKTWARADEHFVTGIEATLLEIEERSPAAHQACEMVRAWLRRRGRNG
jgi:hypothetical protein